MSKATLLAFAVVALFAGSGCVRRELVAFADHETKPLTAVHVSVNRSYLFWSTHEYVFYSCSEEGDKLNCRRLCGGKNDVVCPEGSQSSGALATNIR